MPPLPVPPERFCPSCGADLATTGPIPVAGTPPDPGATAVLSPPGGGYGGGYGGTSGPGGPGGPGGPSGGGSTPWERRDQIGFFGALVETTKQVLTTPTEFFRNMPVSGGLGAPLLYAVIVGYIGLVASAVYSAVFQSVVGSSFARGSGNSEIDRILPLLQSGGGLVVNLIFGPVFIVIGLFIAAGIIHLVLLMLQSGQRGFEGTFRVVAYAEAATLLNVIPGCGGLLGLIYMIMLFIIGVSEAHGISRGKAAAAVLLPLVLFCCCCVIVPLVLIFGGIAGALGNR